MDFLRHHFPDGRAGEDDADEEGDDEEDEDVHEHDDDDEEENDDEEEDFDEEWDDEERYEILTVEDFVDHVLESVPLVVVDETFLATVEAFTGSEVARVIRCLQEERKGEGGGGGDSRAPVQVEDLVIQLRFARHTMPVAKRVTRILNGLGVDALEQLVVYYEDDGTGSSHLKFKLVDHYLTSLKCTPDGGEEKVLAAQRPLKVHLDCLGVDPVAWTTFANRYSPSLESLSLGGSALSLHNFNQRTVDAISESMGRLSNLQSFTANLNVCGSAHIVLSLLRGLSEAPQLEALSLEFDDCDEVDPFDESDTSDDEDDPSEVRDSVNYLADMVSTAKSLKRLYFRLTGKAQSYGIDCLVLLDKAVDSSTLQSVELCDLSLRTSTADPHGITTNESLSDIKLSCANLSRDFWAPLPRFVNLRSIHIDSPVTSQHRSSWAGLFRRLPSLECFTDTSRYDQRITHDHELAAIADNLDSVPLLQKLKLATHAFPTLGGSVEFPTMEVLLRKCKGELDLDHSGCGDDNAGFLSAGIREAQQLAHLRLRVDGLVLSTASVAVILGGLERNNTLQSFTGVFEVSTPVVLGTLEPVLTSLISTNTTLQTFGLGVQPRAGTSCEAQLQFNNALLEAIAAGLVHNQSLKTLKLVSFKATASFRNMLMKNTTLHFVEGIDDSDTSWILTLNRYKRRLLLHPGGLPEGLWTQVLGRIVADKRSDVMFHFLKRLPSSILQGLQRP